MKTVLCAILLVFIILLTSVHVVLAFDEKGGGCTTDCIRCHNINLDEASELLKGYVDKVISVEEGPVGGLWELQVESKGNTFPLYLHYSKRHMIAGSIMEISAGEKDGKTALTSASDRVNLAEIPREDAIMIGNPAAENIVIVFDDPDCPVCRKFHSVIKEVVSMREDIAFHIVIFPLVTLHPEAYRKAVAIACERSLKLLDDAFEGKPIPAPTCETNEIKRNMELASRFGITGTPTLIFGNGQLVRGYMESDAIIEFVDRIHADEGELK